ncbi:hypothetical protein TSAR_016327, partial [Trichomalopsis sarcophagae]
KKSNQPNSLDNLRPISLLPTISKILERVINKSILLFCENNNIIPDCQFDLKKKHSTVHAINLLISTVNRCLNENEIVGACLIDLKKALDSVWLEALIFKLDKLNMPVEMLKIIYNMIFGKKFITNINNVESKKTFEITRGLQQGTVNSPTLFNIFNSSILNLFEVNKENSSLYAIAFADDLIILTAGHSIELVQQKLQDLYVKIKKFYNNWNLEINPSKCETILFRNPINPRMNKGIRKGWRSFRI